MCVHDRESFMTESASARTKKKKQGETRQIFVRFVSYKKRNEFLSKKRDLKNIEGRQNVFVSDDLTSQRCKLKATEVHAKILF